MKTCIPFVLGIYLLFAIVLCSCSTSSSENKAKVHTVVIEGMKFEPAEITVKKGDTVVWVNRDFMAHDVTEETSKAWASQPIPAGKSWKMAIDEPSDYFCSIHPVMKGKIVVK